MKLYMVKEVEKEMELVEYYSQEVGVTVTILLNIRGEWTIAVSSNEVSYEEFTGLMREESKFWENLE